MVVVLVLVLVVVVGLYENNDLACVRTLKNVCYVYFVVSLIVVWSAFALVTTALALVGREGALFGWLHSALLGSGECTDMILTLVLFNQLVVVAVVGWIGIVFCKCALCARS